MLKTYARYIYKNDGTARCIGNGWIEVTKEYMMWFPSGRQNVVVLKGLAIKAKHCEIIQVIV